MPRYVIALSVSSFVMNWLWEMAQMFAYAEMAGRSWPETVAECTAATFGDLVATFAIYAAVALFRRSWWWGIRAGWGHYFLAAGLAAVLAVVVETAFLLLDRWAYAPAMPLIPVVSVGLYPVLQLSLLLPVAMRIAKAYATVLEAEPRRST